jgi:hypothetical protein
MKLALTYFAFATLVASACGPGVPAVTPASPPVTEADLDDEQFVLNENLPPKFLSTGAGLEVEIVYLQDGPEGESRALCRIKGTPHPIVGSSVLLRGEVVDNSYVWRIQYDGQLRRLLWSEMNPALDSDVPKQRLLLPRVAGILRLEYDADRSREIDARGLISLHRQHVKDGTIAKLEAVDREFYRSLGRKTKQNASKAYQQKCGRTIPLEIDWESVFEANRQTKHTCKFVFETAAKLCTRDYDSKRIFNKTVAKVSCAFGDKTQISLGTDGTMTVQVAGSDRTYEKSHRALYDDLKKALSLTLTVAESAKGRVVVMDPDLKTNDAFLGDGKVMRKILRAHDGPANAWSTTAMNITFNVVEEGVVFKCGGGRSILFKPVSDARRHDVLQNAKFMPPHWTREAFGLARDQRGIYYYVDRERSEFGGKNFRVFVGPRGNTKATQLLDVVDDSSGKIFATKSGNLRLVLTYRVGTRHKVLKGKWISKKKERELVILPLRGNKELIYQELGVYDEDHFGTPCE